MNRRSLIKIMGLVFPALYISRFAGANTLFPTRNLYAPIVQGPFKPEWKSLEQYEVPEWFQDAKFGIWAHWGPQCQPEWGDWYARGMYQEGSDQYRYHVEKYGHPSEFGFKDVINEWKADNWDPEMLLDLYSRTGAQYFMALANHHDNLDLYQSTHQEWNSTKVGPKKDIIGIWAKAAKKRGLRFGVSVHAAHAWTWYETAQRSDKAGPKKGIPYDGKLRKADGVGTWWEGMDPQALYAQDHELSKGSEDDDHMIHRQWHWETDTGVSVPTPEYCENFYNRTVELIDNYEPDVVYFDDTALPLWPISEVGLRIAAHYYNRSIQRNNGNVEVVINGKILNEQQRRCLVWDIERGQSNRIEPEPWQTCTCIGAWHYDRRIYENGDYKSAKTLIHMLADVVSKNGNLLLSVPLRGDGSLDDKARGVVEGIADWMSVNKEAIIGTRPWHTFGEGPAQVDAPELNAQGFNEGRGKPFTSQDIRFTTKGSDLYAIVMGWPESGTVQIKSLAVRDEYFVKPTQVTVLGYSGEITYRFSAEGLAVSLPNRMKQEKIAVVIKISS